MILMLTFMLSLGGILDAVKPSNLDVYVLNGKEKGPVLMVVGGIHGDEPSGSKAVELYKNVSIKKGTLILVPRANAYALSKNKRYIYRDMNRLFGANKYKGYESLVVEKLKTLIQRSDMLINLHEGEGFFSADSKNYGQSIVIDAVNIKVFADGVIRSLNGKVKNKDYYFSLNYQKTMDESTKHPEQRDSATCYAFYSSGIPAFGVEVSKDIKDEKIRVAMQCMAIKSFADQLGVKFEKTGDKFIPVCNMQY